MIEFRRLLESLERHEVAFVIVGGIAATLHGSARLTFDLDVVYERTPLYTGAPAGELPRPPRRNLVLGNRCAQLPPGDVFRRTDPVATALHGVQSVTAAQNRCIMQRCQHQSRNDFDGFSRRFSCADKDAVRRPQANSRGM